MSSTVPIDEEKNIDQTDVNVLDIPSTELSQDKLETYDVAAAFLAGIAKRPDAAELLAPWTPEEEKALKRKIDCIVMPLLWLANLMSGTDKVLLGTAVTFGLRTDLKLVGQQYSWANSAIYFSCILFVFPQSFIFQKFSIGKTIGVNVFMYGITTFGTSAVKNFAGLIVCRLLLGVFEGAGHSATGMVISMWWKTSEQPWRTGIMFSTLSSVVNGLLSYALQFYDPGPIARWRLLFVIMGCVSVCVGIANYIFIPGNPAQAWWLNDRQKVIAIRRVAVNQTGVMNHKVKWSQVKEALLDVQTWLIFVINVSLNIPNGGLIGFNSLIVQSLGYSVKEVTLLAIPTGVISWLSSLFFARLATKTRQPLLCVTAAVLICLTGTIMLKQIPRSNKGGSLASLFIMYVYWAPYIIMGSSILYHNIGGTSKKIAVYGISYWGYCVGNLIGPQTFRANEAPLYKSAIMSMLIFYCLSILFIAIYGLVCWQSNKKKEKQEEEWRATRQEGDVAEEWKDLTDKENPLFRYSY
ncbi:uncharacterized protein IL334_004454 [Kwoniella shivajii]|uniref:Major facilitator superfamily (MFS) profile domain-containing protein n=1 Tax=Kwoniella shivajii TaxID=564305 RepID=A0ABZ1D4D6_9TREE|nr:hypothetical protein IL334_004454 [Kwoniella shivajii]